MKLQTLQENLSKALNISLRFVNNKAQLPVLSNFLFKTQRNRLLVEATNLETSVVISIGAKVEKEGEIAVPAKTVTEIVSNLETGTIDIEVEKERLKIISGNLRSTILGINSSDFPKVPELVEASNLILPSKEIIESILKVLFSASVDESRPVLTGVLFIFSEDEISLVATDGFRLSQKRIAVKGTKKQKKDLTKIIIPRNSLSEIVRVVGDPEKTESDTLSLYLNSENSQVVFGIEDCIFSSRVIAGEFPNFEKIIPKSSRVKVSLDKIEFLRAIKIASVFSRENANIVKFTIKKGEFSVSAESSKSGNQVMKLDAKVEGEDLELRYNYRFVEEFLNVVDGEEVEIEFSDVSSPGRFKDTADKNFLHLIMPIKLQG